MSYSISFFLLVFIGWLFLVIFILRFIFFTDNFLIFNSSNRGGILLLLLFYGLISDFLYSFLLFL